MFLNRVASQIPAWHNSEAAARAVAASVIEKNGIISTIYPQTVSTCIVLGTAHPVIPSSCPARELYKPIPSFEDPTVY
jgi:hypothetical protein